MKEIGNVDREEIGRQLNSRAENSRQLFLRRERRHTSVSMHKGLCHAASRLRSFWRPDSQADDDNQLRRIPVPS
jgi:putative transposase